MTVSKQAPGSPLAVTSNTVCEVCSPDWYWHHTKMTVICTTCSSVLHKGYCVCRCENVIRTYNNKHLIHVVCIANVFLKWMNTKADKGFVSVFFIISEGMGLYMECAFFSHHWALNTHLSFPGVSCPWVSPHCVDPGARAAYGQRALFPSGWVCARVWAWPAGLRQNPESDPG